MTQEDYGDFFSTTTPYVVFEEVDSQTAAVENAAAAASATQARVRDAERAQVARPLSEWRERYGTGDVVLKEPETGLPIAFSMGALASYDASSVMRLKIYRSRSGAPRGDAHGNLVIQGLRR